MIYPRIHDLEELLALLKEQGAKIATYRKLIDLNDFAVQFRYEAFSEFETEIDRGDTIHLVKTLLAEVESLIPDGDSPAQT